MLEQLDGLCTCEPKPATVELVSDPTLPLDVEIRTIALDAAVRVIDQAGASLVEGAAKIERFLRGEAVEEPTAVEKPRWTVGQSLTEDDLKALPVGAVVRTNADNLRYRQVAVPSSRWSDNPPALYSQTPDGTATLWAETLWAIRPVLVSLP